MLQLDFHDGFPRSESAHLKRGVLNGFSGEPCKKFGGENGSKMVGVMAPLIGVETLP